MTGIECVEMERKGSEMIVAGFTYWNMDYGQAPGDAERDSEGMENMRNLGRNMAFVLKALS